jgi:hypothetical protein
MLMKVISFFVTWGVIPLLLKRNLVPRFLKGGEAQETINDALTVENRGYQNRWKEENSSVSHAAFPSVCG